jgi:hypothetical protein
MAKKEKSNGHKTETPDVSHIRNVEVTHETSDINVRAVLTFCVVLALSTIVVAAGLWLLFRFFNSEEQKKDPKPGPMALSAKDRLPPEPRLQGARGFQITLANGQTINLELSEPQREYRELRKQWDLTLKAIAIEDTMKKVVSQGLPSKPKGSSKKLEDYAIQMPTAASSGRETEKRLQ